MNFANLTPGRLIVSKRYHVTQAEIIDFARRYDPQWYHLDPLRAASSRWHGLIASGWHTCSIAMRLAVDAVLGDSESIGSPGVEQIRWLNPLRPDMEVQLQLEVLQSRVSRSNGTGIIQWRWTLTSSSGEDLMQLTATSFFQPAAASETAVPAEPPPQ